MTAADIWQTEAGQAEDKEGEEEVEAPERKLGGGSARTAAGMAKLVTARKRRTNELDQLPRVLHFVSSTAAKYVLTAD